MGLPTIFSDVRVTGQTVLFSLQVQQPYVSDTDVKIFAGIQASKLQHQHGVYCRQPAGADVITRTEDVRIVLGATGTVFAVQVSCGTKPTGTSIGTDKKFTVDVQVGSQTVAFTSVLTAPITIDQTIANEQIVSGTLIATPNLLAGQILRVIITAAGSTGTQGQGLTVTITTREDAQ